MTEEELKGHEKAAVAVFLATESGPAQDISDRLIALICEVRKLTQERDELQALIDKQHTRVVAANKRWQAATGEHLTWPDLGTLVQWLLDGRDAVESENASLKWVLDEVCSAVEDTVDADVWPTMKDGLLKILRKGRSDVRTPTALYEENQKLKAAIAEHRDQLDDDRCWLDDEKLYAKCGLDLEEWASALPPKEEFLANCTRYHASRQKPGHPYVTVDERMAIVRSKLVAEVLEIVRAQPFYPDTNVGMRQQWVKDQITTKVEALKRP